MPGGSPPRRQVSLQRPAKPSNHSMTRSDHLDLFDVARSCFSALVCLPSAAADRGLVQSLRLQLGEARLLLASSDRCRTAEHPGG